MKFRLLMVIQLVMLTILLVTVLFFTQSTQYVSVAMALISSISMVYLQKFIQTSKKKWWLLTLMIITWSIGRTVGVATSHFFNMSLNVYPLYIFIFVLSNLFLVGTVIVYFFSRLNRWNRVQLIVDSVMILIVLVGLGSGLFGLDINIIRNHIIGIVGVFTIMMVDFLGLILLLVMISSTRLKRVNGTQAWVSIGLIIRFTGDVISGKFYLLSGSLYTPLADLLIHTSFVMLVITAILKINKDSSLMRKEEATMGINEPENLGKSSLAILFMVMPLILFLMGFIKAIFFLAIMTVLAFYLLFNNVLQKYIMTNIMLNHERDVKNNLEAIINERTSDLEHSHKKLEEEVTRDSLTGLYNRKFFFSEIKRLIDLNDHEFSVLFIDLDRFKVINDIHGHDMGDKVLCAIAERFQARQSERFKFARFGGDEFAIIVDVVDLLVLESIGNEISQFIKERISIDAFEFTVGASIGIARYPKDGLTANELLKNADVAMYHAKQTENTERYVVHSSIFAKKIERRNQLELLLKQADIENDFQLYYQPQFDAKKQTLLGMEALIRWEHPSEGFIPPSEFIPIAEEIGMISKLSDWVFDTGIRQIKRWNTKYDSDYVIGLNVSPLSLDTVSFIPNIMNLIHTIDIKPKWLGIEITEHIAMTTVVQMEEFLSVLSNIGVQISIDDFGTGYSSLSYLKRFDIDVIKIAKELIDQIVSDPNDRLIVKAIIMMSEGMGIQTIAEGVESIEQLSILQELNCNSIQGYVLGEPVTAHKFESMFLKL